MKAKNIGSSVDDFLAEVGVLDRASALAVKRMIARQVASEMKVQKMTKTHLAEKMHASRASLNRLLDDDDPSLTLTTLVSVAIALGKKVKIELIAQ